MIEAILALVLTQSQPSLSIEEMTERAVYEDSLLDPIAEVAAADAAVVANHQERGQGWKSSIVETGSWIKLVEDDQKVIFIRFNSKPANSIWMRFELQNDSFMSLVKYDCEAWTTQLTQIYYFTKQNLQGEMNIDTSNVDEAPLVPIPNSTYNTILLASCD